MQHVKNSEIKEKIAEHSTEFTGDGDTTCCVVCSERFASVMALADHVSIVHKETCVTVPSQLWTEEQTHINYYDLIPITKVEIDENGVAVEKKDISFCQQSSVMGLNSTHNENIVIKSEYSPEEAISYKEEEIAAQNVVKKVKHSDARNTLQADQLRPATLIKTGAGANMPNCRAGGRGGRRGAARGGRVSARRGRGVAKPRRARSLSFPIPKTLVEQLADVKAARALDRKNLARLSPQQRQRVTELREQKQVGHLKMPDAPEPKNKGKGKGNSGARVRLPFPLLPGVPTTPPPHIPQAWELKRLHDTVKEEDEVIPDAPPDVCSAVSIPPCSDIDIDVDRDLPPPEDGSEAESDQPDEDFVSRGVQEEADLTPALAEALRRLDDEADSALRGAIDPEQEPDLLSFNWLCDPENFEGVREVFAVPSTGPTFDNDIRPVEVFLKIWDANIIAHIVCETNKYGRAMFESSVTPNSRMQRWKEFTANEILTCMAIMMLHSLVIINVEREYWYPKSDHLAIGNFEAIMPYNRFLLIKRCLHFVDNATLPEHPSRLDKILPIIQHLNQKFSSLYVLEQNIAVDESLLLWKGRLQFSQKIAMKKARVGIKSYELCESRTGYLWRMDVYSGKGHVHVTQVGPQEPLEEQVEGDEPESATSQIVFSLMRPLFNRGHTLIMDNFYNAPLLSRILKLKHKTDTMGILRLTREFVPEGLRHKNKSNMRLGEVAYSMTNDLSVVVWKDKNVVGMISTYHQVKVGGTEKYGNYKYRPQVILDYNLAMGGIDHKDQMLQACPIERARNIIWYKKLFRRLINVSIHNSFVMFNHNRTQAIGSRDFRILLAEQLLDSCGRKPLPRPLPPAAPAAVPAIEAQMHLPAKNAKMQRCKLCSNKKLRKTTIYRCSKCGVNLCLEGCYTEYHMQWLLYRIP